ncbi:facilitated trehalose transporter Tret1-like [Epargyreus clarus]|uniref:facilitated trehalose transporter Tret1-like n=1 Tax=Epargyreus clarus TaxID=520877 RepID=UPI003C2BEE8C
MACGADIYFWRQVLVLVSDSLHSVGTGFILSFPSVLNSVALSTNTTDIHITKDQASWITASHGFAGAIGFFIVPPLMQEYGRKFAHIILNLLVAIGFTMLAFAQNVATLYAGRIIQGLALCAVYLGPIILAEYAHPMRRGYFMTLKKGCVAVGSLICHSLVLICSWRQIAGIATSFYIVALLLTFLWTKSPPFLAMKGKYEECDRAYTYLNGNTVKSRRELEDLISAQRKIREEERIADKNNKLLQICKKCTRKDFLKPFFIITVLTIIIDSGGRYYNVAYIVQIITDITGDDSVAIYCSIGLDILSMMASWSSTYIITKFTRRAILFSCGYLSVTLMFLISFIVYLSSNNMATNVVWLTPCVILINSFIVNLGVIPICFTVSGEVFPLEHRGIGTTASGIVFTLLYAITMKCTPIMMEDTGIEGTYGIYGVCLLICLVISHFILTETKDKTLQEIEDEMKGIERDKSKMVKEKELLPIT